MRKVFFSFHYERDSRSVAQVRNSNVVQSNYETPPFYDKAEWESIQAQGDAAVCRWIDGQMRNTSVVAVLIGSQTLGRRFVKYEVDQALKLGKGLIGVTLEGINYIGGLETWTRYTTYGPFVKPNSAPIYSWTADNGRINMGHWIEEAAKAAGYK